MQLWRQDGVYKWGEVLDVEAIRRIPARTHGMRNCGRGVNTCGVSEPHSAQSPDAYLHRADWATFLPSHTMNETPVDGVHCVNRMQPDGRLDRRDVCIKSARRHPERSKCQRKSVSLHACKSNYRRRSVRRDLDPKEALWEDIDGGMKFHECRDCHPNNSHTTNPTPTGLFQS